MLQTAYQNGTLHYDRNDIVYINNARKHLIETFAEIQKPTIVSEKTKTIMQEVQDRFTNQAA